MEIIRDTGCNLTKPICSAIMLILFSFFRIEGEYVSSMLVFLASISIPLMFHLLTGCVKRVV